MVTKNTDIQERYYAVAQGSEIVTNVGLLPDKRNIRRIFDYPESLFVLLYGAKHKPSIRELDLLKEAVTELPIDQQEFINLHFVKKQKYSDIASFMGLQYNDIERLSFKAYKTLRRSKTVSSKKSNMF